MITIKRADLNKIYQHAKDAYPYECCGILVGKKRSTKKVVKVCKATNVKEQKGRDRYEIDPEEFYQIDRRSQESGLEIIGFYHSHPDHPPQPSAFDRERAWPEYSYVIISLSEGSRPEARSWVWDEEKREFTEEFLAKTPRRFVRAINKKNLEKA